MSQDDNELQQLLIETFLVELNDRTRLLNEDLAKLEESAEDEHDAILKSLFRSAHSLKGAAQAVALKQMESACHYLEDIITKALEAKGSSPANLDHMYAIVDALGDAQPLLAQGESLDHSEVAQLVTKIEWGGWDAIDTPANPSEDTQTPSTENSKEAPAAEAHERIAEDSANDGSGDVAEERIAEVKDKDKAEQDNKNRESAKDDLPADEHEENEAGVKQSERTTKPKKSKAKKSNVAVADEKVAAASSLKSKTKNSETKKQSSENALEPQVQETIQTVRIRADRLDAVMAKNGELQVARRRLHSQSEAIHDLLDAIHEWKLRWKKVAPEIESFAPTDQRIQERNNGMPGSVGHFQIDTNGNLSNTTDANRVATAERFQGVLSNEAAFALFDLTEILNGVQSDVMSLANKISADSKLLTQTCSALDVEVNRMRILPFREACVGLDRTIRDVAKQSGKRVSLQIQGKDVEVDRSILDGLKDPLMHLVRNSVDHGIELPEMRKAKNKSATGNVVVSARLQGNQIVVSVSDDGKGIDLDRLRDRAIELELEPPTDPKELLQMVFVPGLSTAKTLTHFSGRGVGMDVVKSQIESLLGEVFVDSEEGRGTTFHLTLPLTLTSLQCMLVECGQQTYAIPTTQVRQALRFHAHDIKRIGTTDVLIDQGVSHQMIRLSDLLKVPHPKELEDELYGVVIATSNASAVLIVDEIISEQKIVIKSLGKRIRQLDLLSGATLLSSGKIGLVINVPQVLSNRDRQMILPKLAAQKQRKSHQLLVVDDSPTTRAWMKLILESNDYTVTTAGDGSEALSVLQKDNSIALVVCDVDMPIMNGFELTEEIRRMGSSRNLPVVLVTGRGTDEDKRRGIEAGADDYICKAGFDQNHLLNSISQLL